MITLLTTIHILIAVLMILAVLLQSSKGSDVAGAFGGMGSQAAFGPRGTATFLAKATMGLALAFVITSVALVRLGSDSVGGGESVLSDEPVAEAPATPAAPAGATAPVPAPAGSMGGAVTVGSPVAAGEAVPQVQSITVNTPPAEGAATAPAEGQR
jgi:preprotein translocase subunit SecG